MKAIDIIRRSLLIIRVIDSVEAPNDDDAKDALTSLNTMMRRWEAKGIALGWNTVANVQDDLPAPPEAEEAIAYNLALRLCPLFGKQMGPVEMGIARSGLEDRDARGGVWDEDVQQSVPAGLGDE